jgi:hypothetical protein
VFWSLTALATRAALPLHRRCRLEPANHVPFQCASVSCAWESMSVVIEGIGTWRSNMDGDVKGWWER